MSAAGTPEEQRVQSDTLRLVAEDLRNAWPDAARRVEIIGTIWGLDPPPEPPLGSWVRDRHGGVSVRIIDADGKDGWTCTPQGFYAGGVWSAMWKARGPLVVCEPYGP